MNPSEPSPAATLLGLWMFLQLVLMLGFLLGGLYILYCLNRAASGMERLARVAEAWLASQPAPNRPSLPPGTAPATMPREYTPAAPPATAPVAPVTQANSPERSQLFDKEPIR